MKSFLKLSIFILIILTALIFSGCGSSDIPMPETNDASNPQENTTVKGESGEVLEGEIANNSSECSHSYIEKVLVSATCQKEGLTRKTCALCGKTQSVSVPKVAHVEVTDAAIAATCTAPGKTEGKHCSVCNEVTVPQETIDALGHTEVIDEGRAATCLLPGLTDGKHCGVCGVVISTQKPIIKEHSYIKRTAEAVTCEDIGKLENYCTECKEVYFYDTIPAGHYPEGHEYSKYEGLCTEFKHGDKCSVCKNYLIAPGTYTINENEEWEGSAQFKFEYYNNLGVKQTANSISREETYGKGNDGSGAVIEFKIKFDNYVAIAYDGTTVKNFSGTITITEETFAVVDQDFYNIFSRCFEKGEYTLSGTYEFDNNIWVGSLQRYIDNIGEKTNISFAYLGSNGTKYTATSMYVTESDPYKYLLNYDNFIGVYINNNFNEDTDWSEHIQRYVIFETPQKVSKEFFEWFTSIAAKVVA